MRLPSGFRRPKAELRIEPKESPPESCSGGVLRLQVSLLPMEPFRIGSGRLDLALLTTRFSPTALDGYHEHTSTKVFRTVLLCERPTGESMEAYPGKALLYPVSLPLPEAPPLADDRPTRRQWEARARFEAAGFRPLRADRLLLDASLHQDGAPVVDGRGFLPLYEFRASANV